MVWTVLDLKIRRLETFLALLDMFTLHRLELD